jgi:hypothetical protein
MGQGKVLDRVNATPAGSFLSDDDEPLLDIWVLIFSRCPQDFKNLSNIFVGGLISANNLKPAEQSKGDL